MGWFEIGCMFCMIVYIVFLFRNMTTSFPGAIRSAPIAESGSNGVTIIIAARNEEKNIIRCLQSIALQDFPREKIEVIVVNDHSEDATADIAAAFLEKHFLFYRLIELEKEVGKKAAIQKAVNASRFPIIITRDADTFTEDTYWLKEMALQMENADMLIGPVLLSNSPGFLSSFQQYENYATNLLGSSMAINDLPLVCSGANLAYRKETFLSIDPYKDNLTIASGDDMFLMLAMQRAGKKIHVSTSPHSVIQTQPSRHLSEMLSQRLRWASKAGNIKLLQVYCAGSILLLGNMAGMVALICLFIDSSYLPFCLFTLLSKLIIDFLLLLLSTRIFGKKLNMIWFVPAFIANLLYTSTISITSFFIRTAWKGRKT